MFRIFLLSVLIGFLSYQYFTCKLYDNVIELIKDVLFRITVIIDFINPFLTKSTKGKDSLEPISKLYTVDELKGYNGENKGKLYLSIFGKVFDVSRGRQFYEAGQTYHVFTGRDASKAFITGDFSEEGLTDDISDLSLSQLSDLKEWLKKYETDYIYKGKLIGTFYNAKGEATPFLQKIIEKLTVVELENKMKAEYSRKYPPCNVEWSQKQGSRVWCSTNSGGIKRDWTGVPRRFYQPGSTGYRCACVKQDSEEAIKSQGSRRGNFEPYFNCQPFSVSCVIDDG